MATEEEYKARIKQLMAENEELKAEAKRNVDAALTSHEAYQELEIRFMELQATLEVERAEHIRRVQDLADEFTHTTTNADETAYARLMAALEPFANAGRSVPDAAVPKVFYVPGVHNARTFDLEDLKRAAYALYGDEREPRS